MKLLIAALLLLATPTIGHAVEEQVFYANNCSTISQTGTTFVIIEDQGHIVEKIPASRIIHVNAKMIVFEGTKYRVLSDDEIAEIQTTCG